MSVRVAAIVAAAGSGERFGRAGGKQLAPLAGATVLEHAVRPLAACRRIEAVVVVANPADVDTVAALLAREPKVVRVVAGGATRQESVMRGLDALPAGVDVVVVHDGARPLLAADTVDAVLDALDEGSDAVIVGHPSYDTVKSVGPDGIVERTEDRERLWLVQTPQVFRAQTLRTALEGAARTGVTGTDDAALVEASGGRVRVVRGSRDNVKVTVPEDLVLAEAVLRARAARGPKKGRG
ncbi:2-C-methyl-D-erythritol 4-phosphate cytidylyltransferase [Coriobacteriia bacterium Es71-Z0120]|uniref:2-C-methyl-D-erythritol 4-phosphate cytidylyltransferase n=1 Tax=Parvivirga hydrogeniphila TaxID=2939460 RepID=UPI0022609524|nr:2-C-methyl-D-erythritol 4-phosphate cytidylyltransferase [Parvivirga hydrogeniphila]MCL4078508.1 2-C-methyl-D-erythritol 4-phosphate cytidylyltransferase [Parvivirga hydrogeniphila]